MSEEIFNDVKGTKIRCLLKGRGRANSSHEITITPATKHMDIKPGDAIDIIVLSGDYKTFSDIDVRNQKLEMWISKYRTSEFNSRFNVFAKVIGSGTGAGDCGDPTLITVDNFHDYLNVLNRLMIGIKQQEENPEIQKKRNQLLKELKKLEPDFPDVLTNNPTPETLKLIHEYEKLPEPIEPVDLNTLNDKELFNAIKSKTPDIPDRIVQGAIYDFKNKLTKSETDIRSQKYIDRARVPLNASMNWAKKEGF